MYDERPLGRGRRRRTVDLNGRWRTVTGGGAPVRHPVHPKPAFGPQHRFADIAGRAVAGPAGRGYLVVRELIVVRHRHVGRRTSGCRITAASGRRLVVPRPAGAICEPTARLLAPVRRRVQAVAGRFGVDVHQRHPRYVHVFLDAHAQRGAQCGRSGRRRRITVQPRRDPVAD